MGIAGGGFEGSQETAEVRPFMVNDTKMNCDTVS